MRYKERLETCGMEITGISPDGKLVEIVELRDHPWFLGCQFHPEFKSKPFNPHPLFREFIKACAEIQAGENQMPKEVKVGGRVRLTGSPSRSSAGPA